MQPTHQTSDRLMAEKRLRPEPARRGLCVADGAEERGAAGVRDRLPGGIAQSFPRPCCRRQPPGHAGQPPGGWIPSERLSVAQALNAYTRGGAYAGFAEDKIGALDPGKWADFVLVDRDPTAIDAQALARTEVLETWIAGKKVWNGAPSASPAERGK